MKRWKTRLNIIFGDLKITWNRTEIQNSQNSTAAGGEDRTEKERMRLMSALQGEARESTRLLPILSLDPSPINLTCTIPVQWRRHVGINSRLKGSSLLKSNQRLWRALHCTQKGTVLGSPLTLWDEEGASSSSCLSGCLSLIYLTIWLLSVWPCVRRLGDYIY